MLITYYVDPPAHPVPEYELVSYTVRSRNGEDLSRLIRRMLDQNPEVSGDEIVRTAIVDVNRRSISIKACSMQRYAPLLLLSVSETKRSIRA